MPKAAEVLVAPSNKGQGYRTGVRWGGWGRGGGEVEGCRFDRFYELQDYERWKEFSMKWSGIIKKMSYVQNYGNNANFRLLIVNVPLYKYAVSVCTMYP